MIHITHLDTNIKGLGKVTLGPRTRVVGPNASGKSALVAAIELVLTGRVTSESGKSISQGLELMALHPTGSGELYVKATFSDGFESTWSTTGSQGAATKPVWVKHPKLAAEPLPFTFWKAALNGTSARNALLRVLLTKGLDSYLSPDMLEHASRLSPNWSEWADQIGASKKTINKQLSEHRTLIDEAMRAQGQTVTNEQLAEARAALKTATDALHAPDSGVTTIYTPDGGFMLPAAKTCPTCGQRVVASTQGTPFAVLNVGDVDMNVTIAPPTQTTLQTYQTALAAVERLEAAASAKIRVKALRDNVAQLEEDHEVLIELEDAVKLAIKKALKNARSDFRERVEPYVRPNMPEIVLSAEGREVCYVGFARADHIDTLLSGTEWCQLIAAVAVGLAADDDTVAYVIPEDRAWDSPSLGRMLTAFAQSPLPMIVATVTVAVDWPGWVTVDLKR